MSEILEMASPTVEELFSQFRSSFFSLVFQHVEKTLMEREQQMEDKYLELKKKAEEEKHVLVSENLKLNDELKKKQNEIDAIRKLNVEYETKFRVYEKRCLDFDHMVLSLEKLAKESRISSLSLEQKDCAAAESNRPPLFSEKKDSKKKAESNLKETILIDDDDDDDDDDKCISSLKGKHVSNKIKREYTSDDDDLEFISTSKRGRISDEMKSSKVSPSLKNIELDGYASDSGLVPESVVNSLYMSSISKMKKQKEIWEFEADMVEDFEKDYELCMNGVCALHRQKIIVHGSDISSIFDLACRLIDGDSQNKLQKKASELNCSDLDDCRKFAKKYSLQLFDIYLNKSDPFFPASRSQEKSAGSSSSSLTPSTSSTLAPTVVVRVIPTNRKPELWQFFDLCEMSKGPRKARCKVCNKLYKPESNSTLTRHLDKYCKLSVQNEENEDEE